MCPTTEELDIWRIAVPGSGQSSSPERITYHNARVAYLAWLDARTLIYSATAEDGSGQWLYALDTERRIPHRVSSGITEQYLSVAASATQPRRLLATVATPSASLWTVPISDQVQKEDAVTHFPTPNYTSPRAKVCFRLSSLSFFHGRQQRAMEDGGWRCQGAVER